MTYVIANTQNEGTRWAKIYLPKEEKYKVLSTSNQIRGRSFFHADCLYIVTGKRELGITLLPSLCGCTVHSHNEWISGNWKKNHDFSDDGLDAEGSPRW